VLSPPWQPTPTLSTTTTALIALAEGGCDNRFGDRIWYSERGMFWIRIARLLGLKPGHTCDPMASVSGVHFLTGAAMIMSQH
jgi:hypothetical protein